MESTAEHTLYDIVTISPANAGFGEYQVSGAHTGEPVDLDDYLAECAADGIQVTETHELDGLIHDQPSRVYAVINDDGTTSYLGANPSDRQEPAGHRPNGRSDEANQIGTGGMT